MKQTYSLFVVAAVLLSLSVYLIINAPQLLLPSNVHLAPKDLTVMHIDARRYMSQILGGGLLLFGLFLIYKRIVALEKNMLIAQEAQITERFTRAIDQLGTYKLEVQLGGIFALEKIARDSAENHWMIMEILTAYVRENAKWNEGDGSKTQTITSNGSSNNGAVRTTKTPTDIQTILTVLGRRRWIITEIEQMKVLNLRHTNLAGIELRRLFLERTNFRGSNLTRANLTEAKLANAFLGEVNLSGALLTKADLRGANLVDADLSGADLRGADLTSANLTNANLTNAFLSDAQLQAANLTRADLQGVDLCGVSLLNVNLTNARLHRVTYDYNTIFPDWVDQDLKEELKMNFNQ